MRLQRAFGFKLAKKGAKAPVLAYGEALEAALCYGWIDGRKGALDKAHWLQKFTPRGPSSAWSKINCVKAQKLIEAGRMKPAGLARIDEAQRDGRWERAYDPQSKASVPGDFQDALDKEPRAAAFFGTLDRLNRYAILYRIQRVKRPQTRARRITEFIAMLRRREKIHP